MALSRHLHRLAQGDFTRRVPNQGPSELRALGHAVNEMTADLARMYAVERERRASAEALATRERELSAAKEFWTNTLVHDLQGTADADLRPGPSCWSKGTRAALNRAQAQARSSRSSRRRALWTTSCSTSTTASAWVPTRCRSTVARSPHWAMLLRRVVDDYRGLGRAVPDLQVRGDLAPVQADARLICRVLGNLIGNAYKHAGASAQVALVAEPTVEGVLFAVDDDGPGIPEVDRERVFERFIQGHGARRGSGLGLAFCKLVVDQIGWTDLG